jgi:hypothetical protein
MVVPLIRTSAGSASPSALMPAPYACELRPVIWMRFWRTTPPFITSRPPFTTSRPAPVPSAPDETTLFRIDVFVSVVTACSPFVTIPPPRAGEELSETSTVLSSMREFVAVTCPSMLQIAPPPRKLSRTRFCDAKTLSSTSEPNRRRIAPPQLSSRTSKK